MTSRTTTRRPSIKSKEAVEAKEVLNQKSKGIKKLSPLFEILGNKSRFQVAVLLYEKVAICVSDLCFSLGMSAPALSQHLRKMRESQIVTTRKQHRTVYYSLAKKHIETLEPILGEL